MTGLSTGTTRLLATKKFSLKLGSFLSNPKGLSPVKFSRRWAKLAVRAGVPAVPLELLAMTLMTDGILFVGKFVHRAGPNGDGEADQQHGFENGDDAFA
jgi:hypothetical protein